MKQLPKQPFVTTVEYLDYPEFVERANVLYDGDESVAGQLKLLIRILQAARSTRILLLNGPSGTLKPDLLAAAVLGFWRKTSRPLIVIMGDVWQKDPGIHGLVQKFLLRLADRAISRYLPLSAEEIPEFSRAWGIPENKARYLPYFFTITQQDLNAPEPAPESFVFSGGNAFRDYESLLKAAEALPDQLFVIASRVLDGRKLPPNAKAGHVSRPEFIRLMRASRLVVVPNRQDIIRSVGQQTYLNAMMLGKPTIINRSLGVCDYVRPNETALVVDGTPENYVQAIRWVLDEANRPAVDRMCRTARESVLRNFSFENHCEALLRNIDEVFREYSN